MSEAERAPNGGKQGSLKQSEGHWKEDVRDRWAELMLEDAEYDDLSAGLTDIVDEMQKHDPEMTVTDAQVQRSYLRFCEKNPQLLESEETAAPAAAKRRNLSATPSRKPFKKLLVLAATLVIVLSLFTVQASGFNLFRTLAEWTASVLRIGNDSSEQISMGENDLAVGETRVYETPEEMLTDLNIKGYVLPTWLPERFSLQLCEARKCEVGIDLRVIYTAHTGCLALKWWQDPNRDTPLIEKDQKDVLRLFIYNIEHYIFHDEESGMEKAVWNDGDFGCRMMGDVSQEELERIVKSVYGG